MIWSRRHPQRIAKFPNLIWLKMHTSEGIVGLGETFFFPATVEAYVHEAIAPKRIGRDPFQIERILKDLVGYLGFRFHDGHENPACYAAVPHVPAVLLASWPPLVFGFLNGFITLRFCASASPPS